MRFTLFPTHKGRLIRVPLHTAAMSEFIKALGVPITAHAFNADRTRELSPPPLPQSTRSPLTLSIRQSSPFLPIRMKSISTPNLAQAGP